jgi:hypothetical protein
MAFGHNLQPWRLTAQQANTDQIVTHFSERRRNHSFNPSGRIHVHHRFEMLRPKPKRAGRGPTQYNQTVL